MSAGCRPAWTCPECWDQGVEIQLLTEMADDGRAVEQVITTRCPRCERTATVRI